MKGTTAAVFFGFLIIAVAAAWFFVGGPAQAGEHWAPVPPALPAPMPAALPAASPVTTPSPPEPVATNATPVPARTTVPVPTTVVTTATPLPQKPVSADRARDHFLDIAYSATNRLERFNATGSQDRITISVVAPGETDAAVLSAAAAEFNAVSKTVTLSTMIKETDNGGIVIKFLPEDGLDSILLKGIPDTGPDHESLTQRVFTYNGKTSARVLRGTIYINNNLKGEVRNHTIARTLFYEMGATGETVGYPDSLFYSGENTNVQLNGIDKKAIAMLYEPGLANGMTIEDLRKVMPIS